MLQIKSPTPGELTIAVLQLKSPEGKYHIHHQLGYSQDRAQKIMERPKEPREHRAADFPVLHENLLYNKREIQMT